MSSYNWERAPRIWETKGGRAFLITTTALLAALAVLALLA